MITKEQPTHADTRGDLAIDISRGHLAGRGLPALENIMAQFDAFAITYAQETGLRPQDVTLQDYINYLKQSCA